MFVEDYSCGPRRVRRRRWWEQVPVMLAVVFAIAGVLWYLILTTALQQGAPVVTGVPFAIIDP